MTPRQDPPALAVCLLQRFVPSERGEALLGDLIEKFNRRRSARWFWREVLIAILIELRRSVHTHKGEIVFALIATMLQELWWSTLWWRIVWQSNTMQSLYGWGLEWRFPLSGIYGLTFDATLRLIFLLPFVGLLLSAKGTWSRVGILRAVLISFALLNAAEWIFLLTPRKVHYISSSIPFFCALLVSTWRRQVPPLVPSRPSPIA